MSDNGREDGWGVPAWVALGSVLGAGAALLFAPKTGEETRELIRATGTDWARRARERAPQAREALGDAQAHAQALLGHGREALDDRLGQLRDAFEAGWATLRQELAQRRTTDTREEESTMADDRRDELNFLGALGLITVGALVGAAAALLLAPKSGEETREYLREKGTDFAKRAQERSTDFAKRAQETVGDAQARAQDYLGRSKEAVEETTAQLRAAFEAGRGAMRDEISRLRGKDEPLEGV